MKFASLLTVLLALAIVAPAQVTVGNNGFATSSGAAYPATPVSPPLVYAPIVHLDQGATQPMQATAAANGVMPVVAVQAATTETQTTTASASNERRPFNFGVAQFGRGMAQGGVGQTINGKSLGEVARELRHGNAAPVNARTFTNSDINNLKPSGGISGAATASNHKQDNWTPDNGVINPNGMVAQPDAVGAPQNPDNAPKTPFGTPKSSNIDSNQPTSPQAYETSGRQPYEMAQNNQPPIPQDQNAASQSDTTAPAQNENQAAQLPHTASKLPLIGVLGLFTVCMGFFVRYQREREKARPDSQ
ncbi:MAG TPA: hypothetical protein VFP40_13960 [Terriglobales bacterium]|nr:hypothetical protein [Terriglobales bacterium]